MKNKKSFLKLLLVVPVLILVFGFCIGIVFWNVSCHVLDYAIINNLISVTLAEENTIINLVGVSGMIVIWSLSVILAAIFFGIYSVLRRNDMIIDCLVSNNKYSFEKTKKLSKETKKTKSNEKKNVK